MSELRKAAQQAILLCRWIDETPHERGSINGMAAQVQHALEQALSEPEQDKRTTVADLRDAMWLDPECAERGACQSLKFKGPAPTPRKPLTDEQKLNLVTNWFAEDWAIKKALGLLHDYEIDAKYGTGEQS